MKTFLTPKYLIEQDKKTWPLLSLNAPFGNLGISETRLHNISARFLIIKEDLVLYKAKSKKGGKK